MRKKRQWKIWAVALALTALCGTAALAAGGDEGDPLITLSYLEQVFRPSVMNAVEQQTTDKQTALDSQLKGQIDQYQKDMEQQLGTQTEVTDHSSFVLVTLSKGQVLKPEIGCEMLLRVGTATVDCGTNPALIDISTGGTLNKGNELEKNHLYLSTMVSRTVTATAKTVKILVRGDYAIG